LIYQKYHSFEDGISLKVIVSIMNAKSKKKRQFSTEDCRFFLFFSLFSFRSSLFPQIVVSREKIREKREEKR
jgi:hypothetical protein